MSSMVLACIEKCVYACVCAESGKRKIAEHQKDLLLLNVLDVSRHSGVDGSEQAGIWTDT